MAINGMGRPSQDGMIYKIRVFREKTQDTEAVYRCDPTAAYSLAAKHRAAGTLLFFGRYELVEELSEERTEPLRQPKDA